MTYAHAKYTTSLNFFGKSTPQQLIERYGSPLYVYNEAILRKRCQEMLQLCSHPRFRVFYSTKANANLSLLRIIQEEGLSVDAMSPGELALHQKAGFDKNTILYVCNNISANEMRLVADNDILLSVDSLAQLDQYGTIKPGGKVMVRMNPGIGAGHHKKVVTAGKETKFGVQPEEIPQLRTILTRHRLQLVGLNQHVGSLFMDASPFVAAAAVLLELAEQFDSLEYIDFGGGFGIPYHKYANEARLDLHRLGQDLDSLLHNWCQRTGYTGSFGIEPGRYISAECGLVLGTVQATKTNQTTKFVGTDVGFSILARPMLYDAFHDIEVYSPPTDNPLLQQTIVGNICESGDVLAKDRTLPPLQEQDIFGVLDAGAYGYTMASTYNQRPRPAEVLIRNNGEAQCIRRAETIEDLLRYFPE